jgi:GDP-mannose 6-dehydrogenase
MRISVFGLGYVGCVTAACLAREGHTAIGVDVNPQKVELVAAGRSPVLEPGLDELISEGVRRGRLLVTSSSLDAVRDSEISIICVGTPSNSDGSLDLQYVKNVCREIGAALAAKRDYHVVIVRSTVLPGTVREKLVPVLEQCSGKAAGPDFGVCMNPEFLREGCAVQDYYEPSTVVIGELDSRGGDVAQQLFPAAMAPFVRTTIESAEMVKYASNALHAMKVVFANEVGNLAKAHGIDGREVMDILCQDRRLNISPAYLQPGFAFGGSCLPKDLRALLYRAKERDVDCPLLSAVLPSNERQVQRAIELVEDTGQNKVGILGLSFKANTDDVRESPIIPLIETLVGRGYRVCVYDDHVDLAELVGANKSYLEQKIPSIASLMRPSIREVVEEAKVVVVAHPGAAFSQVSRLMREHQTLIDLVGIADSGNDIRAAYRGICW